MAELAIQERLKRAVDVAVSSLLLVFVAPVLALAALTVAVEDGLPVIFAQERVGRRGRTFRLFKLRTMRRNDIDPEALGQVQDGNSLVLRVGRPLRRLKIDELPQLWNVLQGDMSLVGPRPTIPGQVERYEPFQRRRLEVRPGLTGWAQIHGNTSLTWDERILLDVWYIDHRSFWLDARILLGTIRVVILGERRAKAALEEANRHAERAGWGR